MAPSGNPYCLILERIRNERDDAREDALQGRAWSGLGAALDLLRRPAQL